MITCYFFSEEQREKLANEFFDAFEEDCQRAEKARKLQDKLLKKKSIFDRIFFWR